MIRHALLVFVLVLPVVAATSHLPAIQGVRVETSSQQLHISWTSLNDTTVVAYHVRVTIDGARAGDYNVTAPPVVHFGQNNRAYTVTVAALEANGDEGPPSTPVTVTAQEPNDMLYLVLGLATLVSGVWAHGLLLSRSEARANARLAQTRKNPRRLGDAR